MYLAFQQHTNEDLQEGDNFFGAPSCSWLIEMGPEFAVAAIDTRGERTRERIVPADRITEALERVNQLPESVKHLLWISAVPVAYPEVSVVETGLECCACLSTLFQKTGTQRRVNVSRPATLFLISN